jgi:hypothetical protein
MNDETGSSGQFTTSLKAGPFLENLEHLIYASAGTHELGAAELAELLEKSRVANASTGLTGMLLHSEADGSFFQILEGTGGAIDGLVEKLQRDNRHCNFTNIIREPIRRRTFGEWTMGFSSASPKKLNDIPGLNDFFSGGACFRQLDAGRAKKLLAAFAGGSWHPQRNTIKGVAA